jgi:hypothetical protein
MAKKPARAARKTATKGSAKGTGGTSTGKRASTTKRTSTGGTTGVRKAATLISKLARSPLAERWISGPGDEYPVCAAVALANSLLAVTGQAAGNGEIERLYRAAGGHGDSGAPVGAVLGAAIRDGLGAHRLRSYRQTTAVPGRGGVLLLDLPGVPDLHAVAVLGDGLIATWGDAVPLHDLDARICGAWSLAWHGEGC